MSQRGRGQVAQCRETGSEMMTAAAAFDQVRHTRGHARGRSVMARHCGHCGAWHVNVPAAFSRKQRMLDRQRLLDRRARLAREAEADRDTGGER